MLVGSVLAADEKASALASAKGEVTDGLGAAVTKVLINHCCSCITLHFMQQKKSVMHGMEISHIHRLQWRSRSAACFDAETEAARTLDV